MRRPASRVLLVLSAVGVVALAAACSSSSSKSTSSSSASSGSTRSSGSASTASSSSGSGTALSLTGTAWVLASRQGTTGTTVQVVPGSTPTLDLTAKTSAVTGSTGCNQFTGTFTQSGVNLTIMLGPMTKRACTSPLLAAQESSILDLLPKVTGYHTGSAGLVLTGPGNATLLTYKAGLKGLEGTSWIATGVNNGKGALVSQAGVEKLTADFGANDQFSGSNGCNQLGGTWTTTGDSGLKISVVGSTMMACADPAVDALSTEYTAALGKVTTYDIKGDVLTLRDSTGAMQVTYHLG